MPIYEYRRPDGSTFDVLQKFSDKPLEKDPETGVPVKRMLSPVAVHFKGSGFYSTDYGSRKRARETQAAAEGSSSGDGKSAGDDKSKKSESAGSTNGKVDTGASKGKKAPAKAK